MNTLTAQRLETARSMKADLQPAGKRMVWLFSAVLVLQGCATAGSGSLSLYDTHAHFFSADVDRYPIDTRGAKEGPENLAVRVQSHPNDTAAVLAAWHNNGVSGGVGVQYASVYKTDNSYLLAAHADYPNEIAAVVGVDPLGEGSAEALTKLAEEQKIVGIRFSGRPGNDGNYSWIDAIQTQKVWAAASDLGLAVVIMNLPAVMSPDALERVAAMAEAYPHVQIVLDHVAWSIGPAPDFGLDTVARITHKYPNISYKVTSINFDFLETDGIDSAAYVRRAVDLLGADRMMWGSDFGNTNASFREMAAEIQTASALLTKSEKRKLFYNTGHRIFRPD